MIAYSKKHKDFTLIEFLLVAVIIGVLAATVLPAYQDYTVRNRVSEWLILAAPEKLVLTESLTNNGSSTIAAYKKTDPSAVNSYGGCRL